MVTLFLVIAVITFVGLGPVRSVLRRAGIVDKPNSRSSHSVPTVRGGGVVTGAVIVPVIGWLGYQAGSAGLAVLLAGFALLAVVSFVDDIKGLPARVRFVVHVATAAAAIGVLSPTYGERVTVSTAAIVGVGILWTTAYTNAFNFMDGINGIAGVQAVVTGIGTAAVAEAAGVPGLHPVVILALAVAGAALGFLPHNFPRARVFMGDVGSAPLGFLLAVLAFWVARLTSWWVLFWVALLHANFVLDTGISLIRRAHRGDRLSDAHREHFYQRLVRAGWSHTRVTLTEAAIQICVAGALWWATPARDVVKVVTAAVVIGVWLVFFAVAERTFRRSEAAKARRIVIKPA